MGAAKLQCALNADPRYAAVPVHFYFVNIDTQSQHYFSALETLLMRSTNACYLLTYLPSTVSLSLKCQLTDVS